MNRMKDALHHSNQTVYVDNEAQAEDMIGSEVYPMDNGESRRIIHGNRVYCLYKMDSGRIELNSYELKLNR